MAPLLMENDDATRGSLSPGPKQVTFSKQVRSCIVERITIVLDREEVWYTSQECHSMRRQAEQIANLVRAGGNFRESENNTARGLEGMISDEQRRRRFYVKYAVSEEIYRQRQNNEYDPEGVADASQEVSQDSVEDALVYAERDAKAAAAWVREVTEREEEAEAAAERSRQKFARGPLSLLSTITKKSPFGRAKFVDAKSLGVESVSLGI